MRRGRGCDREARGGRGGGECGTGCTYNTSRGAGGSGAAHEPGRDSRKRVKTRKVGFGFKGGYLRKGERESLGDNGRRRAKIVHAKELGLMQRPVKRTVEVNGRMWHAGRAKAGRHIWAALGGG